MNVYAKNARAAYVKNEIANLSREEIVVKLYQALCVRMRGAIEEIKDGRIGKKAEHLSRALAIVLELQNSLDMEQGGEIAENLNRLYDYMASELMAANLKNDIRKIEASLKVAEILLEGWVEIAKGKKPEAKPALDPLDFLTTGEEPERSAINY